jgi:branched-chain amino acid transport system substrate-binding protein
MKIAVIHEDSAFGSGVADAFMKRAGELGLKVVLREPYSAKRVDLAPLVLKLKGVAPDVILAT